MRVAKNYILGLFAVFSLIGISFLFTKLTFASDISWVSPTNNPSVETSNIRVPELTHCSFETFDVAGQTNQGQACLTKGKYIKAGMNFVTNDGWWSFVSFPGETKMHKARLGGWGYINHQFVKDSNSLMFSGENWEGTRIYDNVAQLFYPATKDDPSLDNKDIYNFNFNAPYHEIRTDTGGKVKLETFAVSKNGKWAVGEKLNYGLVRINLDDYSVKSFAETISPSWPRSPTKFAISNDGRHVVASSYNAEFVMYDVSDQCGTNYISGNGYLGNLCPKRTYNSFNYKRPPSNDYLPTGFQFSDDGGQLSFTYRNIPSYVQNNLGEGLVTLSAPGYPPTPRLDYLALGDSYSSGEGDTEKIPGTDLKWYRDWTDNEEDMPHGVPREKCHISLRSYPYKLARVMNLTGEKWDTIACGGATTWDIKAQGSDAYNGQGKGSEKPWSEGGVPRLEGYDINTLKYRALNDFIPGRQKQIEFLKKYKPKAITLTIGGNDVGFGGKITSCLLPIRQCPLATLEGRRNLGIELRAQFKNLISTYEELRGASPATKIYVLGYTQVLNGNMDADCSESSIGDLDDTERRVITEAYTYMNHVVEAAASYTGIKYINLEDVLKGHRLCDSSNEKYATGLTFDANPFHINNKDERQESFHPNAKGHQAVTDKITDSLKEGDAIYDLLSYPYSQQPDHSVVAPNPSAYFASDQSDTKSVQTKQLTSNTIKKNTSSLVTIDKYSLDPGSSTNLTLHSDPLDLGNYTSSLDGSLSVTISIPSSVPAGYHTLILTGKTYTGTPVQYEQVVFVYGSNLADIDEDGINDDIDKCLFITPLNVDKDSDGIDDACDSQIDVPKVAYRIRGGNATTGERSSHLYIERNIYATEQTGISGDYDSDHDGWVIVGASQNGMQAGPYSKFWIDQNKTPHVSIRTVESGCVQYKPANLSKVTDNTSRTFILEAEDANTCRVEPLTADMDNNGLADNTQPLYRARNGDISKGENPTKLYLERSTRAAEAQLGKSDYAPSRTPPTGPTDTNDYRNEWSLLASSQPNFIVDTYRRITFVDGQPYVLAANFLGFCSAYKAQSLATIRQSTQNTRQLQGDWTQTLAILIQGGCNG